MKQVIRKNTLIKPGSAGIQRLPSRTIEENCLDLSPSGKSQLQARKNCLPCLALVKSCCVNVNMNCRVTEPFYE